MALVFKKGNRGAGGRQIQMLNDNNDSDISDEALIEKLKEVKFDTKSKKIICSLLPKTPGTL